TSSARSPVSSRDTAHGPWKRLSKSKCHGEYEAWFPVLLHRQGVRQAVGNRIPHFEPSAEARGAGAMQTGAQKRTITLETERSPDYVFNLCRFVAAGDDQSSRRPDRKFIRGVQGNIDHDQAAGLEARVGFVAELVHHLRAVGALLAYDTD